MNSSISSPMAAASPSFVDKYLRWVPLLTPAVTSNGCEIDVDLVSNRTTIVILAIGVLNCTKWSPVNILVSKLNRSIHIKSYLDIVVSLTTIAFVVLLSVVLPAILLKIVELNKAQKVADENAVNAYLSDQIPPEAARKHISSHLSAARLLVSRHGDVNRLDQRNLSLLSEYNMNMDVFKYLVDQECDLIPEGVMIGQTGFHYAVLSNNPEYLRYLVDHNRILWRSLRLLSNDSMVSLWTLIIHREIVDLMKERLGFDINLRDSQGYTALGRLLEEERTQMPEIRSQGELSRTDLIALLREKGAVE